jgi:3-hydroxybutyryl-CoA dehydrogenase
MNPKRRIAVLGAGQMGTAIATLTAAHGYDVVLCDNDAAMLESFAARALPIAQYMSGEDRATEDILGRIEQSASLEHSVRDAFLIQESIDENLEAKRTLFQELDALCGKEIILATNTSSFLLSEICGEIRGRERVIGIHYVAPAHLVRAVEIITSSFTDPEVIGHCRDFVASIDHVGIVCRERPGFLINRIQYALKAEVHKIIEEGVSSVGDIDAVVRLAIGPRLALWGPMLQEDMSASKKTVLSVTEYLQRTTGQAQFAVSPLVRFLAESGQIGAAAGAGWYTWDADHEGRIRERDRQLETLLTWLRENGRLDKLGVTGENDSIRGRNVIEPETKAVRSLPGEPHLLAEDKLSP